MGLSKNCGFAPVMRNMMINHEIFQISPCFVGDGDTSSPPRGWSSTPGRAWGSSLTASANNVSIEIIPGWTKGLNPECEAQKLPNQCFQVIRAGHLQMGCKINMEAKYFPENEVSTRFLVTWDFNDDQTRELWWSCPKNVRHIHVQHQTLGHRSSAQTSSAVPHGSDRRGCSQGCAP